MSNTTEKSPIILLAHSKIIAFEWGKILIDIFQRQTAKKKIPLHVIYRWQDVKNTQAPVIVVGVDSEWLQEVFTHLDHLKLHAISLNGKWENEDAISHISADQQALVRQCISLLRTSNRTQTAFFGVQKNDTSDHLKALAFEKFFDKEDVYFVDESVEIACGKLLKNVDKYDSVICANDVMAIYLLKRCRALNIQIPEKLFLIGNGNLWLSEHVTPSLTTITYNPEAMVDLTLYVQRILEKFPASKPIQAHLNGSIVERESTSATTQSVQVRTEYAHYTMDSPSQFPCPELAQICNLDRILSLASKEKYEILKLVFNGVSYSEIAKKIFLSEDTVHYHIKKVYKQLNIHSKNEFIDMLNAYGIVL